MGEEELRREGLRGGWGDGKSLRGRLENERERALKVRGKDRRIMMGWLISEGKRRKVVMFAELNVAVRGR